ncbi:MAG: hypothetical protein NT120_03440 [Candidatus Aenigmarchaeota archaeon]|nr:hypothetical protein [Candidatus Aenigmarchaeota archaeon]
MTNVNRIIDIEKGKRIYLKLQESLGIEEKYRGEYIAIDIGTEKYFIGETRDEAVRTGRAELPEVVFYVKRIGGVDTTRQIHFFPGPEKFSRARFL